MLDGHLETVTDPSAQALVFTFTDGTVMQRRNNSRPQRKPATEEVGFENHRMHDLRHTAAALMISVNRTPEAVKRQL